MKWVREYDYKLAQRDDMKNLYFFQWHAGEGVYYNEILKRVNLGKIKIKETKDTIRKQGRPAKIFRVKRELLPQEKAEREQRQSKISPLEEQQESSERGREKESGGGRGRDSEEDLESVRRFFFYSNVFLIILLQSLHRQLHIMYNR